MPLAVLAWHLPLQEGLRICLADDFDMSYLGESNQDLGLAENGVDTFPRNRSIVQEMGSA